MFMTRKLYQEVEGMLELQPVTAVRDCVSIYPWFV